MWKRANSEENCQYVFIPSFIEFETCSNQDPKNVQPLVPPIPITLDTRLGGKLYRWIFFMALEFMAVYL